MGVKRMRTWTEILILLAIVLLSAFFARHLFRAEMREVAIEVYMEMQNEDK